jgi:hypothetical protein
MKIKVKGLAAIAGVALLGLAAPAHGQITINFTNIVNTNVFGDGYVDPYAGTVYDGGTQIANNGLIVCDDYKDEITYNETWNVTAIQASKLTISNIGNTMFGGTIGLDGYAAVASLVSTLLSLNTNIPADASEQADLSAAIWYITSGGQYNSSNSTYSLDGYVLDSGASSDVATALSTYAPIGPTSMSSPESTAAQNELENEVPNLWILTPSPKSGYNPDGVGEPQEMWSFISDPGPLVSTVPEGGTALLYLLLAGAACFGAAIFKSRSQIGERGIA